VLYEEYLQINNEQKMMKKSSNKLKDNKDNNDLALTDNESVNDHRISMKISKNETLIYLFTSIQFNKNINPNDITMDLNDERISQLKSNLNESVRKSTNLFDKSKRLNSLRLSDLLAEKISVKPSLRETLKSQFSTENKFPRDAEPIEDNINDTDNNNNETEQPLNETEEKEIEKEKPLMPEDSEMKSYGQDNNNIINTNTNTYTNNSLNENNNNTKNENENEEEEFEKNINEMELESEKNDKNEKDIIIDNSLNENNNHINEDENTKSNEIENNKYNEELSDNSESINNEDDYNNNDVRKFSSKKELRKNIKDPSDSSYLDDNYL
jgi:hypothetical protein